MAKISKGHVTTCRLRPAGVAALVKGILFLAVAKTRVKMSESVVLLRISIFSRVGFRLFPSSNFRSEKFPAAAARRCPRVILPPTPFCFVVRLFRLLSHIRV